MDRLSSLEDRQGLLTNAVKTLLNIFVNRPKTDKVKPELEAHLNSLSA